MRLANRTIDRVTVVDDDADAMRSYGYYFEDLELASDYAKGPLPGITEFVANVQANAQAAVCDYKLRAANYATYNGDELVAALYDSGIPAILCTRWEKSCIEAMRRFRRKIPVLLTPNEFDEDTLVRGLELCVREIQNEYSPERRPWRALVRIEYFDDDYAYVIVPSWNSQEGLRVLRADLPAEIRDMASQETPFRCHAMVNKGAQRPEDLYFFDWEAQ